MNFRGDSWLHYEVLFSGLLMNGRYARLYDFPYGNPSCFLLVESALMKTRSPRCTFRHRRPVRALSLAFPYHL
jgi:hypothetical protein